MKTNQITIITITAALLFTLIGCDSKGGLERTEPKSEIKSATIYWTVNGPVDEEGNPIVRKEVEFD